MEMFDNGQWLPLVFMLLMGVSMLAYVVLDGYDLGVGILMGKAAPAERDTMIASIGPFWDANETWLVLGIGILLVAFPMAHGIILTALYLPVALMLAGLILRGVAFDFRAKAQDNRKRAWDRAFIGGSFLASFAQGYMLGSYITGFDKGWDSIAFAIVSGIGLVFAYVFMGSCWLILKTEHELQKRAIRWARITLWLTAAGMAMVSVATPLVSARIFEKWFTLPNMLLLAPIPASAGALVLFIDQLLRRLPRPNDRYCWLPFTCAIFLFILGFQGLGYSFYPYIVPDRLTVWEAASAPESLKIILVGALVVLPCIAGYTIFAYRVFRGKVRELTYY